MELEEFMNIIRAFVISSGKEVYVYQSGAGSSYWRDLDGYAYNQSELDFTKGGQVGKSKEEPGFRDFLADLERRNKVYDDEQKKQSERLNTMFAQLDTKAMAEQGAKIAEREYWRKLRGDIALEIIRQRSGKSYYTSAHSFELIADMTKVLFDKLYDQDQTFFKDK